MANMKPGPLAADVRGKIGTQVFSRGQGGAIVRSIGTWTQPNTTAQVVTRSIITLLATAWSDHLSEAQRQTWWSYARTSPRPNTWGTANIVNGYSSFIRHNAYWIRDAADEAYPTPPVTADIEFPTCPTAPPIHPPTLAVTVQQAGQLIVTGTLSPDATGAYDCIGQCDGHALWSCTTAAGLYYILQKSATWYLSPTLGVDAAGYWTAAHLPGACWSPAGGATGNAAAIWSYSSSLARITTPPAGYTTGGLPIDLFIFTGKPIRPGRNYYQSPWSYAGRIEHPQASADGSIVVPWTMPTRATTPAYAWTITGTDSQRFYAVAQDRSSGAISGPRVQTPTMGSVSPW